MSDIHVKSRIIKSRKKLLVLMSSGKRGGNLFYISKQYFENLSVIVTKDQAGSADRGRPITSKFSAFFLYQIRLRSVVFLVK